LFEQDDLTKRLSWKLDADKKRINLSQNWLKNNKSTNKVKDFEESMFKNFLYGQENRKIIESSQPKVEIILPKVEEPIYTPGDLVKKLSNEEIYSLIEKGKTNDEIICFDSSLTYGKIGARRAWITMRNEKLIKTSEKSNQLEEKILGEDIIDYTKEEIISSKKDLSKEDAIWLLKQGYSTKEILQNYPQSFGDYQLRGYKAQITAGRL
jgi:hypothetical protein